MRQTTLALLSATLLATGATMAAAQDRTDRPYGYGHLENGPTFSNSQETMSRSEQRSMLRRQMREEGFRDIRISDAVFFVQARTPDGRMVMMAVSPTPGEQAEETGNGRQPMAGRQQGMQDMQEMRDRMAGQGMQGMPGMQQGMQCMQGMQGMQGMPGMQDRMARQQRQMQDRDATGAIATGMDEEQIRSRLQDRGFSDIRNWTREDGVYTATADWYGEEVDVRVDARSGALIEPSRLEDTQIETLLQEEGFEDIRNVRTEDGRFRARADRDDATYTLEVDPRTGRILGREEREG
jgi:hypothetical protein